MNDDGGSAYPHTPDFSGAASLGDTIEAKRRSRGISMRDHFAEHALVGMGMWCPGPIWPEVNEAHRLRAEWAYAQADAMLEARKPK